MANCISLDWHLGPQVHHECRQFDFTLFFEAIFLSAIPSAILLICLFARLCKLSGAPGKAHGGILLLFKMAAIGLLMVLQITLLILTATTHTLKHPASLASGTLAVVGSGVAIIASFYEHTRSVAPSSVLQTYFSAIILLDMARVRTLWLIGILPPAMILNFVLAFEILVFSLESVRKKSSPMTDTSTEERSGLWERALFTWLLPMLRRGYSNTLSLECLPIIDFKLGSRALHDQLVGYRRQKPSNKKCALMFATIMTYWSQFVAAFVPRLLWTAFKFAQPFLINTTIRWVEVGRSQTSRNTGYGLIAAYALVYVGLALSQALYWQNTYHFIVMVRGGLISMIFQKTMKVNPTDKMRHDPMVLMGTDIEKIALSLRQVHEVWASIVEIAIALWLLEKQMGAAFVAPAVLTVVCLLGTARLSAKTSAQQRLWMEKVQERLTAICGVLADMRAIKLLGLSKTVLHNVTGLRGTEVDASQGYRTLLMWSLFVGCMPQFMSAALTFAIFAAISAFTHDKSLLVAQAFTSLSLISLLTYPLNQLVQAAPQLLACSACFSRIQEFLNQPEKASMHELEPGQSKSDGLPMCPSDVSEYEQDEQDEKPHISRSTSAISIRNASFAWSASGDPTLHDINLEIPVHSIEVLCGPVGSGKSTLIHGILGNARIVSGSLDTIPSSLSYCGQTSWLISGTIRDNITAGSAFDKEWYMYTLWVCSLDCDLQQLPMGDITQVGSNGAALSGGQKQRVALARLVYSRARIAFCDDVFSGLDVTTERDITIRLFGPEGYFRKHGVTVLLATHSRHVTPFADHITTLSEGGRIETDISSQVQDCHPDFMIPAVTGSTGDYDVEEDKVFGPCEHPIQSQATDELNPTTLDAARRTSDTSVYLYYARAAGLTVTVCFLSVTMACTFCESFAVLWLQWWARSESAHPSQRVGFYLGIYIFLNAFGSGLFLVGCWLNIVRMTSNSALSLHQSLLDSVVSAPLNFFVSTEIGITTNRFGQDMELVDMTLPLAALNAVFSATGCIMDVILVAIVARYLAAAIPLVIAVAYVLQKFYLHTSRQVRLIQIEAKAPLYNRFIETISGLATIQAFGWQQRLQDSTYDLLDLSQKPFYLLFCIQLWVNLVLNLIVAGLAVVLVALIVTLTEKTNAGFVGVALVTIMNFNMSLTNLIKYWTMLETSMGAISRIKCFVRDTEAESEPVVPAELRPGWPEQGYIEISNLTASYGENLTPTLRNVSLSIRPGEKIAICGSSGSGKSSLLLTLLRVLDPVSGTIHIDGIDLATVSREQARQKLNAVPQDPFFLNGTHRANMDPYGHSSDEQITLTLEQVGLWAAVVSKGGLNGDMHAEQWSQGELQLLCLARAMLREGNILILDEITSSVDRSTEAVVQDIIARHLASHTILSVIHRLDHVRKYDKVALLEAGEVVEFDDPTVLLAQTSRFAALYASRDV